MQELILESDLVPMVEDTYKLGSVPIADELYAQSYGCQKSSSTHCAEHGGASEPARDTFPLNAPPRGSPSAFLYWGVGIM